MPTKSYFENLKRRKNLQDLDLKEMRHEGIDWIQLVQDKVQWWAVVNIVMNLYVS
jgi:hypothetical protein